jgi:amidophosphoribosyltransferase
MPAADELIASGRTEVEVEKLIGADRLIYQDLDDLIACARGGNPKITHFDCSVCDGKYVTGDIDAAYLKRLEGRRNDQAKRKKSKEMLSDDDIIDLYNEE